MSGQSNAADSSAGSQHPSLPPPHQPDTQSTATPVSSRLHTRQNSIDALRRSRANSSVLLADMVRRNDPSMVDFASMDGLDLRQSGPQRIIAIPNFSTVSLTTVWVLNVLGSILCFVLAEVYQKGHFTHEFPLTFVASLACHLSVLSSFAAYLLGRQKHGARVYHFYQPFAGGQHFVVVQFFGVFAMATSFFCTWAYVQALETPASVRPGVFLTTAVLSMVGDVLVYLSPRYFDKRESSAAAPGGTTGGAPVFSLTALLAMLRDSPNTETVLVCALASGQALVSWAAHYFRDISPSSAALVLVMQLCIGVLIHVFIGCRTRPGYRGVMLRLPRSIDTFLYHLCWLLYSLSVWADVWCMRHFRDPAWTDMPASFYYGALGLNTFAALCLLFLVRTTSFRKWNVPMPSTVFEYGGLAVSTAGLLIAACGIGILTYLQLHAKELEQTEEGRARRRLLSVGSYLTQGFALMLSPMIQAAGRAMHGEGFSIFRPYRGIPSFLLIQGYGWLTYASAVLSTAFYILTQDELSGTAAVIMATLSTISITFSLREYSLVKLYVAAQQRGEVDHPHRAHTEDMSSLFESPEKGNGNGNGTDSRTEKGATLADIVTAARSPTSRAAAATSHGQQAHLPGEGTDSLIPLTYICNGEMIAALILAVCNVAVRFVIDVFSAEKVGPMDVPVINMLLVAHWLFVGTVPLAHFSGRDKGIHVLRPFAGSGVYVALQVLGWFLYALFVVVILIGDILILHYQRVPTEWMPALRNTKLACTLIGLLQVIPVVCIALSIVFESVVNINRRHRAVLAKEAFETIRAVLQECAASTEDVDVKAIMQLAFTTLMEPALQAYDLPFTHKTMQLYTPNLRTTRRGARSTADNSSTSDTEREGSPERFRNDEGSPLHNDDVSEVDEEESGSQEDLVEKRRERRRKHEGARIIVILMSCASTTLFVVAASLTHTTVFALACAVCGLLLCTVSCIATHVGYGMLMLGDTGEFAVFMPFKGGSAFVNRQIIGWLSFAVTFLITLVAALEDDGLGPASMLSAGVLSVLSQVFIFESIPRFTAVPQKRPSFLEQNGEGVVAVLAFAGSLSFAHVYERLRYFLYSDDSGILTAAASPFAVGRLWSGDWRTTFNAVVTQDARRSKVPFVLALLSILVAVPFVLIAMARTTRQWEKIARKARRELRKQRAEAVTAAAGHLPDDGAAGDAAASATGCPESDARTQQQHHRYQHRTGADDGEPFREGVKEQRRGLKRGMWAVALTNFLEVATMLCGTVIPFSLAFLVIYVSRNYSPRIFDAVLSYLPSVFLVALVTLVLSVVPYLANVGVPPFCISLRITFLTYCLYGMPVLAAAVLFSPAFLYPCIGTRSLAAVSGVLAILGSYKQVRHLIQFGVYSLVGYCTYQLYLDLQARHSTAASGPLTVPRILLAYAVNCLFLSFWVWYLPLYNGKPEISGAQRSLAFTHFLRQYVWEDTVRFFNFSMIVDDPTVHMRDRTMRYLFSFHPHGVFPGTALFCPITKEWQRKIGLNASSYVSTHVAGIIFNVPLIRDFNLRQGALSVSRRGLEASLSRGNSVIIVTGGQAEMLHTQISDKVMTLVTQHKGFIRIAIRNKVPIVPLLCFGEQNILGLVQFPRIQKVMLKILGFPFPMLPYGGFGLPLPRRAKLTLVVGKPIAVPAEADPDNEEHINTLNKMYFEEVEKLFYRHREQAGYPELELVLVDDKEAAAKRRAAKEASKSKLPLPTESSTEKHE